MWLVISLILLPINILVGISDIKFKRTGQAAFTWAVVGWLLSDIVQQLITLL